MAEATTEVITLDGNLTEPPLKPVVGDAPQDASDSVETVKRGDGESRVEDRSTENAAPVNNETPAEESGSPRDDRKSVSPDGELSGRGKGGPKWALRFREGKGDLWSSSFRLACNDKKGNAFENRTFQGVELSDLVLNALMENFDSHKINRKTFMEALFSPLLKLNLSEQEKEALSVMYDFNKDRTLDRDEVGSLCRELLGVYCMKTCTQPKKTWCRLELPNGEFISVNRRYYRLSFDHPIERDIGDTGPASSLEIRFKETFDYALAEILQGLKLTRRQQPISRDFILAALKKFYPLSSSRVRNELDKKVFGGQTHPTYNMQDAVEKLKACIFLVNKIRYPNEMWTPLTTEHRGIFWLNNKTEEVYGCLPPLYVRLLQYQIKDLEERLKVIPGLRKREEQANALEIETAQQKERILKLEGEITFLQNKISKNEKDVEVLQRDLLSRSEELSSSTIDIQHYKKTIAMLERRIEEYEKIYSQYELNKELLKFSQRTVKEKEDDVKKRNEEIETLHGVIKDLEYQVSDLNMQKEKLLQDIREEVKLNEEKEMLLEVIPEYEKKAKQADLQTLAALRQCEQKDKEIDDLNETINRQQKIIDDFQNELKVLPDITQDTKYLSCQVWTLKKLLSGKDEIIRRQLNQIKSAAQDGTDGSSKISPSRTNDLRKQFSLSIVQNFRDGDNMGGTIARTGITPNSRPVSRKGRRTPSAEWRSFSAAGHKINLDEGTGPRNGLHYSAALDLNHEPTPDYHDFDLQASKFLHKGFRVSLREMKREKYGKVPLTGTIKWLGTLDRRKSHHRLYVGLKLDSKQGNTDGLIHGHRMFTCEPGFGKFILAEEIESVFDKMQGKYLPMVVYLRLKEEATGLSTGVDDLASNRDTEP